MVGRWALCEGVYAVFDAGNGIKQVTLSENWKYIMKRILLAVAVAVFCLVVFMTACTHKPQVQVAVPDGNYPAAIAKIITNKCISSGCHNAASYQNAGELRLDTWEHMLEGGVSGAIVVPYSTKYSPLLYYICPDSTLGFTVYDPGHLANKLTKDEYLTVANWVAKGAPDKNGVVPFAADAATRQKIYLTVQGCNLVAVIDAKSRMVMRYIEVGDANNQAPHDIEISEDGKYAYVPFYQGSYIQKIDVTADTVMGSFNAGGLTTLGSGRGWSVVTLSPLDTAFVTSGWTANSVLAVNAANMQLDRAKSVGDWNGGGTGPGTLFPSPHGLAANRSFDTFYSTLATSVIKYAFDNSGAPVYNKVIAASGQPHQIEISPDDTKYFVTCPNQGHPSECYVRVYDRHADTLIKAIPVGAEPQEMAVSVSQNYLFVSCMEDAANPQPNRRGSVYVIDMGTLATVKVLYGDFYQPHDITVDERDGILVVPSRNASADGPAPHHVTACGGKPGWYSIYNLSTLLPESNKRYEVSVDPYGIATRFK